MRVKNVRVTIKGRGEVLAEAATVFEKLRKREKVEPYAEVSFENIETLRKFLTDKRLELLYVIKKEEPDSVYELAQLVERDFKSVNTDLAILEELGLISLEKMHDARKRVKPILEFERINVEIAI